MASNKPILEELAKELGYKSLDDMKKSVRRTGSFSESFKGRLAEGEGFSEAFKGGLLDVKETAKRSVSPKRLGKQAYGKIFGGDDILSAYMRGRLAKKQLGGKTPSPDKGEEGAGGSLSGDSAAFIKIIAKNSMSLHLMARDVNVLRQNVQKLVKIKAGTQKKGSKAYATGADAYFLKAQEREKALEASRQKLVGKSTSPTAAAAQTAAEGGGFFSIVGSFLMAIVQQMAISKIVDKFGGKEKIIAGLKKAFNPRTIFAALSKGVRFIPIIGQIVLAVVSIGNGLIDAVKEFVKSGSIKEAFYSFMGGVWEVITFGLVDKDVIKKYLGPVIDPIFDIISNIFGGLKSFVKRIFGIKDDTPPPEKKEEPGIDAGKFATGAAKAAGESDEKARDIGSIFGSVQSGDMAGTLAKAQEFSKKYPETPTEETSKSPTPAPATTESPKMVEKLSGETIRLPSGVTLDPNSGHYEYKGIRFSANNQKELDMLVDAIDNKKIVEYQTTDRNAGNVTKTFNGATGEMSLAPPKQQSSPSLAAAPAAPAAAGVGGGSVAAASAGGSVSAGGSSGSDSSVSATPSAASGGDISSASSQVSEGQRMESAADMGSVVNAPVNNTSVGKTGSDVKTNSTSAYDYDLANALATT